MTYVHPIVVDAVYTHSIYSTANYRVSIIIANGMRQHSHSIPSIRLTITLYGRHIPSHELSSPSHSLSLSFCVCFFVALSMPMVNCECCLQQGEAQMSVQITSRSMSSGVDSTRHVHWPWRGNSTKVISIPALSAILPYE